VAQNKEQEDIGLTFEQDLQTYLLKELQVGFEKIKLCQRLMFLV
jgi:hypothetical protein